MDTYPTTNEVDKADRIELCRLWMTLPTATGDDQRAVLDRIVERFGSLGGFTPEVTQRVGWLGWASPRVKCE